MPKSKFILSDEDKLLIARLKDFAYTAENKYTPKFTPFLDERQLAVAKEFLLGERFSSYMAFGGHELCRRKVVGLFPDTPSEEFFPIVPLEFSYREQDKLSHRDFLGALMALGIKREMIGDIFIDNGRTIVFAYDTVSENILSQISKVGSVGVKLKVCDKVNLSAKDSFTDIDGVVASVRADCIVALATGMSRAKSAEYIKSNGIDINFVKIFSPSYSFSEGDTFSVRGFGKFIFSEVGGMTRKEKLHIKIKKYT